MTSDNKVPKSFTAGETIFWVFNSSKFSPKNGWRVIYILRSSKAAIDIEAKAEDDCHIVKLSSEETINYVPALYCYQCFAKNEESKKQKLVETGYIEIKPNLANLDNYDGRSHVKKTLDALESVLEGKATRDQLSYSIAGRSISRMNPSEILQWRDKYRAEYVALKRRCGILQDQIIKVRF